MIFTHPYWSPTRSGANEMCFAGGGVVESYRPRFPLERGPYFVVRGRGESTIVHHVFLSFVDDTIVPHKLYPIPDFVCNANVFDWHETSIRKHE